MHIYHSIRTKKKTAEDIIAMVNVLRDEVQEFTLAHSQIEDRLAAMADDVDKKFDSLFALLNVRPIINARPSTAKLAVLSSPAQQQQSKRPQSAKTPSSGV
jgi:hypothetical protein